MINSMDLKILEEYITQSMILEMITKAFAICFFVILLELYRTPHANEDYLNHKSILYIKKQKSNHINYVLLPVNRNKSYH